MSYYLNLPKHLITNQRLSKKLVFSKGNISPRDKKLFDNVDSMYVHSILAIDSIGIRGYKDDVVDYDRIIVLDINLNSETSIDKLCEKLHMVFPNPTILSLHHNDSMYISVAHKRISMSDKTKTVVTLSDTVYLSNLNEQKDFLAHLDYKNIGNTNLYDFYVGFCNRLYLSYITEITKVKNMKYSQLTIELVKNYVEKKNLLAKKQEEMNKFVMMRDQMRVNIEIEKIKEYIDKLIQEIKEEQNG